jgi:protein-S-isoprenylcysteine O-methyltransferase Ste14
MVTAILGYGLLVLFFGLEFFLRRGSEAKSLKPGSFDQGTAVLVAVSYPLGIFLAPLLNGFSIGRFPGPDTAGMVGVIAMIAGLGIRVWSMQTLGRFYTRRLTIAEGQKIVQAGPYRILRHPGYLGTLLVWIGLPATQANWIALCALALLMGIAYGRRINLEENMLVQQFGEEYRQYMKRTWRLVPFIF